MRQYRFLVFTVWVCLTVVLCSCNDLLDQEPQSSISPEKYLLEESQLASFANNLYEKILPSHGTGYVNCGIYAWDGGTDNMASLLFPNKYVPGEVKVPQTDGSTWSFKNIYKCNYFLENVLPRYELGVLSGSEGNIRHYIGEMYFLRACEYFKKLQAFGDFPIVEKTLPDEQDVLTEASKRMPRNEVARFILTDLDKAIELMETNPDTRNTRINKESALLLKSRVALYEGTFLKYFQGTPFVPLGEGWPGATKDYNKSYSYPTGNIENEINYFLEQSMNAAKQVAESFTLTENTGIVQQSESDAKNPYMDMFASIDLSANKEVLLWREYNLGLGIYHSVGEYTQNGYGGTGVTRGFVDGFLMENGLPIYASNSGYKGDDYISTVRSGRDNRLVIFLKEPGQRNIVYNLQGAVKAVVTEPVPTIYTSDIAYSYSTGYCLRKGNPIDGVHLTVSPGTYTASIAYRGVEALLNYMEASYERNKTLDATALGYWKLIRARAKVDTDINKTIAATEMEKEALNDWGAYSGGVLLSDKVLYNIRRERRCELMAEGLRGMDLQRWRSYDQMIQTPYHIEGFKLWGPMKDWYTTESGSSKLIYGGVDANVSSPERSMYLRPYEKANTLVYDGYRWAMAHYLNPIAIQDILITSENNELSTSPIYQNPYWPSEVNGTPIK